MFTLLVLLLVYVTVGVATDPAQTIQKEINIQAVSDDELSEESYALLRSLESIDIEKSLESVVELINIFQLMYPKIFAIIEKDLFKIYDPQTKQNFGTAFLAFTHILKNQENRSKLRLIFNKLTNITKESESKASGKPIENEKPNNAIREFKLNDPAALVVPAKKINISEAGGRKSSPQTVKLSNSKAVGQGAEEVVKSSRTVTRDRSRSRRKHGNVKSAGSVLANKTKPTKSSITAKNTEIQISENLAPKIYSGTKQPVSGTSESLISARLRPVLSRAERRPQIKKTDVMVNGKVEKRGTKVANKDNSRLGSESPTVSKTPVSKPTMTFAMMSARLKDALQEDEMQKGNTKSNPRRLQTSKLLLDTPLSIISSSENWNPESIMEKRLQSSKKIPNTGKILQPKIQKSMSL